MKLADQAPLRFTATAISRAAILVPAALALAGCAAGAGGLAAAARPARPVTAYVVNYNSDTVTPIPTATNTALKPVKTGYGGPDAIAITPNGKTAYIANGAGGGDQMSADTVTPIRTSTNTALKPIKTGNSHGGSGPDAIAITPNGKTAYVANGGGDSVTPINIATDTALQARQGRVQPRCHRDHTGQQDRLRRQQL